MCSFDSSYPKEDSNENSEEEGSDDASSSEVVLKRPSSKTKFSGRRSTNVKGKFAKKLKAKKSKAKVHKV